MGYTEHGEINPRVIEEIHEIMGDDYCELEWQYNKGDIVFLIATDSVSGVEKAFIFNSSQILHHGSPERMEKIYAFM